MLKNIVQRLSGSYSKAEGYLLRNPFNRFSSVDGTVTRPPADDVAVTKDDGSKLNTEAQRTLDLLDKWKKRFQDEKVTEIQPSLEIILAHVLEKRKLGDITKAPGIELTEKQITKFEQLCRCRLSRMPVQYVIGQWDFRDLTLQIEPPVFIPRPETEELVELILQQTDAKQKLSFLEIGCGTGAISLALAKSLPKATGTAIDQSNLAVNLARKNMNQHQLLDRLQIFQLKVDESNEWEKLDNNYDLIVSNPPYIKTADIKKLQPEIQLYEDLRALDGGPDGMKIILLILKVASKKLRPGGHLWLETDPSHPTMIDEYLSKNSELNLRYVASYQDLFHKERFVEIAKVE